MTNKPEPNTRAGEALLDSAVEQMGEALFNLSSRLKLAGTFTAGSPGDRNAVSYEKVVLAWQKLTGEIERSKLPTWDHYAEEHVDSRPLPQPSELVETPEAFNKKKERCLAYVEQHWKWGNLTRLGIVNQLVRDGFRQTWAIEQADRIAPAANQAVAHITQLEAQIAKLQARLEVVPGWSEDADGIACRNDTIKLQDECIAKLQADGDKLAGVAQQVVGEADELDELGIPSLADLRQALTEWKDRA